MAVKKDILSLRNWMSPGSLKIIPVKTDGILSEPYDMHITKKCISYDNLIFQDLLPLSAGLTIPAAHTFRGSQYAGKRNRFPAVFAEPPFTGGAFRQFPQNLKALSTSLRKRSGKPYRLHMTGIIQHIGYGFRPKEPPQIT